MALGKSINKVRIKACRGSREADFDLEGKSAVICGENGTGKSSLVEALEYFFTGTVPRFSGEASQGLSFWAHFPHCALDKDDLAVEVWFAGVSDPICRTPGGATPVPPGASAYWAAASGGTFALHRYQMLAFIACTPAERYREIGNLIGVAALDATELSLIRAKDTLSASVTAKQTEIADRLREMSNAVGQDISSPDDALPTVNARLQSLQLGSITSWGNLPEALDILGRTIARGEASPHAVTLAALADPSQCPILDPGMVTDAHLVSEGLRKLSQESARRELGVIDVLAAGKKVIEENRPTTCPLCQQNIDPGDVLSDLSRRLGTLRQLSEIASSTRQAARRLADLVSSHRKQLQRFQGLMERTPDLTAEAAALDETIGTLHNLAQVARAAEDDLCTPVDSLSVARFRVVANRQIASACRRAAWMLAAVARTEREGHLLELHSLLAGLRRSTGEICRLREELAPMLAACSRAESAAEHFSGAKRDGIAAVYESIKNDMNRYYLMVHPHERISGVQLQNVESRRASSTLSVEQLGLGPEDPRARSSEAHLDSLGLCIFLAFVRRFNPQCSLLVLDDVLTSVDAPHRARAADLLLDEFADKQLIVTTHDEAWFMALLAGQEARNRSGDFKNMRIVRWSLEEGPVIDGYLPRWDGIVDKLDRGDKMVTNEARIYLEWVLKRMCSTAKARVTFRADGRYEVGDLLGPAAARLAKMLQDEAVRDRMASRFRGLVGSKFIANPLSHDGELIALVSIQEVKDFCIAVKALHEALLCQECGAFLEYVQEAHELRCVKRSCPCPTVLATK